MLLGCYASKGRPVAVYVLALLTTVFVSISGFAQSNSSPQWDVFAGYQWLHPGATVPAANGDPNNPTPFTVPDMSKGFGGALTYNFDPYWGLEFDAGHNWGKDSGNSESTFSAGPRFMVRTDGANYFVHALLSDNWLRLSGLNHGSNGIGAILGGGMDLPFTKTFAFRLFEADYVWARHNYAPYAAPQFPALRRPTLEGARLRTGIVFNWGGAEPVAPAASCSVQPSEVLAGEPITATVSASNFNPKHSVTYSWSGNGGQVTGKDTTASIANAAPGTYTVTAHVTDPKAKKNNEASCTATYTVKPLPPKNPPTMSLSASPTNVITGGTITVTASCTSPDGVPVSVANWTSTAGTISDTGTSATLSTAGVPAGPVTVNATCTDSRGLTGQGSTQVTVENPPPPPVNKVLEARLSLHSVYFPTAQPSVENPTAGLVASQQKILTELAADFEEYVKAKPDAHLILEGHADPRGSVAYNQALSERRVARVKGFLVEHGVPDSAIETKAMGDQHNLTADEVKASVEQNPQLTSEERARTLRNMRTIILASNRRVDIRLSTTGEVSTRQFPFNAEDALTLIGGRTPVKKAPARRVLPKKRK
jgi:outer membrane protein OmpA-like peptidoglycan-associated protein